MTGSATSGRPPGLWVAAWLLARKDLRQYFRDKVGMALGFLLPLALVAVFGFIMGRAGGSSGMPRVEIAVVDLERSPESERLVEALAGVESLDLSRPDAGEVWSRDDALARVRDGDEPMALVIPEGYAAGAEPELILDPGREIEQQLVAIGLFQALIEVQGDEAGWALSRRALLQAGLPEEWSGRVFTLTEGFRGSVEALFTEAETQGKLEAGAEAPGEPPADGAEATGEATAADGGGGESGVDLQGFMQDLLPVQRTEVLPEGRQEQITYQVSHAVSGMTVMMLMFSLVGFGRSLLAERDRGTLRRLLAAPIDARAILLSKFLGVFLIGLLLIAVLFTFSALVFELDVLGRLDTLVVLSAATALACTGFAVAIAAWAKTDKQADGVSTLVILLMSSIGGCWMPLMLMPEAVQLAARCTLPYWSLSGYQGSFWHGMHWTEPAMLRFIGVQLAVAAALAALAGLLFHRRYRAG
ncbi:MAG TPA: ABC transporter permease [Planctomycetota bacterium]|nr:ABC transporter permease [Planctomycetota bacterium]